MFLPPFFVEYFCVHCNILGVGCQWDCGSKNQPPPLGVIVRCGHCAAEWSRPFPTGLRLAVRTDAQCAPLQPILQAKEKPCEYLLTWLLKFSTPLGALGRHAHLPLAAQTICVCVSRNSENPFFGFRTVPRPLQNCLARVCAL